MTNIPKQTMWPCTNPEIHAKVQQMLEDAAANPSGLELDIFKIIRGDMNEMNKLAIAAGLQQMSEEDRAAFKAGAGEIVDIMEEQFRDNKGIVMNRTEEINFDGVRVTRMPAGDPVEKIQGVAGDYDKCGDIDVKGVSLRGMNYNREVADDGSFVQHEPQVVEHALDVDVAQAINATDADAVGIQHRQWPKGAERSGENDEKFQKVGTIASSKNSAALMAHLALQARQPGKNIDLGKALANDLMGDGGIREVERAIKNQYHPAVEHTITADKSKHHLNAAAGWSMMNPSAHQFMWVKFYGDDTEYTIDRAVRNYNGALQFTLSDQRVINVGAIDRHNTSLSLQNPKIRAIHIKSSRRY